VDVSFRNVAVVAAIAFVAPLALGLVPRLFLVHRHYRKVGRQLRAGVAAVAAAPPATNQVVL
jgi:hypothetical protein